MLVRRNSEDELYLRKKEGTVKRKSGVAGMHRSRDRHNRQTQQPPPPPLPTTTAATTTVQDPREVIEVNGKVSTSRLRTEEH